MALEKMVFKVFPLISLWELKTIGAWPIWTPGACSGPLDIARN